MNCEICDASNAHDVHEESPYNAPPLYLCEKCHEAEWEKQEERKMSDE